MLLLYHVLYYQCGAHISCSLLHLRKGVNVSALNQYYYTHLFRSMCVFVSLQIYFTELV